MPYPEMQQEAKAIFKDLFSAASILLSCLSAARLACFMVFVLAGVAATASGDLLVFDFESEPADGETDGSLSSLTLTSSDFSVVISRSSGVGFDVINDTAVMNSSNSYPDAFGNQALSPFNAPGIADVFVATFSEPVTFVSIDAGDFGADEDDISLMGFTDVNATGGAAGSDGATFVGNLNQSGGNNEPITLSISDQAIRSITFVGSGGIAGSNLNSVFFDNLTVRTPTTVPEPATGLLLCSLAVNILLRRRR